MLPLRADGVNSGSTVGAVIITQRLVNAGGLEFGLLEAGTGPLALCLHGFPDTAHTWRHLLPALADSGYHAVAPFLRGYAPTAVPTDGAYQSGALIADAIALHEALGGDANAVLVGHDWGARAAYGAGVLAPERWRRIVALAVPPPRATAAAFADYAQLKRSFYMFLFQLPIAERVVGGADGAFIRGLWADWEPGYDAVADLEHVARSLAEPGRMSAAIGYYRAMFDRSRHDPRYAAEQAAEDAVPPQPTLYLHGEADGCLPFEALRGTESCLSPGSRVETVPDAGHFLHLRQAEDVNKRILGWLAD
jgi:pimeloyl-ACP methyl ester carboxylesterase